jgi:hypothetical protein
MNLDVVRPEPTCQPKAVAAGLIGNRNALDAVQPSPPRAANDVVTSTGHPYPGRVSSAADAQRLVRYPQRASSTGSSRSLQSACRLGSEGEGSPQVVLFWHGVLHHWPLLRTMDAISSPLAHSISLDHATRASCPSLTATLTTTTINRSSLQRLEIGPWLPTPKGPPTSFMQLRVAMWTGYARDTRPVAEVEKPPGCSRGVRTGAPAFT